MDMNVNNTNGSDTAISIFGQNQGVNDFPVLKAFQEYIDAEQSKARKRMLGLSIFFIVLLMIVVVTFTLIVIGVINRNQSLSDRLLEVALRQQQPVQQPAPPVVSVPAPQPVVQQQTADLKPVLEKIEQLTTTIANQSKVVPQVVQPIPVTLPQQTVLPQQQPPAPAAVQPAPSPTRPASDESDRVREQIKREREQLAAERKKFQEEKHKEEVERHRRRLYPEYYAQKDQNQASAVPSSQTPSQPSATPSQSLKTIKPVNYFNGQATAEDEELAEIIRQSARRKAAAEAAKKKAEADAAEAATRKAASEAARRRAEAEAAEADKRKKQAEAARHKAEAESAEAQRRAAEAEAKRQKDLAAEAAKARAAASPSRPQANEQPKTETINVGAKDNGGVPWIIQRLEER